MQHNFGDQILPVLPAPWKWKLNLSLQSHAVCFGSVDDNVSLSVGWSTALFQSEISQQLFNALIWHFDICGAQRMKSDVFDDHLTFPLAPTWGWCFWFEVSELLIKEISHYYLLSDRLAWIVLRCCHKNESLFIGYFHCICWLFPLVSVLMGEQISEISLILETRTKNVPLFTCVMSHFTRMGWFHAMHLLHVSTIIHKLIKPDWLL